MAKVNKDELIDGIAQDYVDNSGDTATITFGNLRPKLDTAVYPKGTLEITSNGQHNVRTYENVDVEVPQPTGTIEIIENGTYNIFDYAQAEVDVPTGGALLNNVTLNADGTYTVTDKDENEHTLAVTETDGQITAITYDGNNVSLDFNGDDLTGVGDTDVDVSRYSEPSLKDKLIYYNDFDGHSYIDNSYIETLSPSGKNISTESISVAGVNSSKCMIMPYGNSSPSVVSRMDITGFSSVDNKITIGGWANWAGNNYEAFLMINGINTYRTSNGVLGFDTNGWTFTGGTITAPTGFHHIAYVINFEGTSPYIIYYLDGYPMATTSKSNVPKIDIETVTFGRVQYCCNKMTSIFIANDLLSTAEIQELMTSNTIFT